MAQTDDPVDLGVGWLDRDPFSEFEEVWNSGSLPLPSPNGAIMSSPRAYPAVTELMDSILTFECPILRWSPNFTALNFSVSSSENGDIDIDFGSTTIRIPKQCSVHHPVLHMVLLAFKKRAYFSQKEDQDTFSCAHPMVPKAIVYILRNSRSDACGTDVCPVYEAGWVAAKIHSTKFNGAAVPRTRKLVDRDSAGTLPDLKHLAKNPNAAYALATTQSPGNCVPVLWLDSGATHHAVGDGTILSNLQDPPAGTAVRTANGSRLLVTKVGDIDTGGIKIPDVYLVPGLMNLISVRQLAKSKIITSFYENHAELWREGEQIGGAIADNDTSLYRLRYLTVVGNAATPMS